MVTLLEEQTKTESARLALLLERDGREATLAWAKRTLRAYQDAVENPHHFASTREYHAIYETSISVLQTLIEKLASGGSLDEGREGKPLTDPTA